MKKEFKNVEMYSNDGKNNSKRYFVFETILPLHVEEIKCLLRPLHAFTLAEVLITLTIIGVIAAMTIPNLMKNYQNHANYVALKKGYSTLNNAYKLVEKEYGTADNWNLSPTDENIAEIAEYFLQYMKYTKKCFKNTDCWVQNKIKDISGTKTQAEGGNTQRYVTVVLQDSSIISIQHQLDTVFVQHGTAAAGVFERLVTSATPVILYDVNGKKGPNQFGRDIFGFVITKNGLVPAGRDSTETCSTDKSGWQYGMACTYKVLQEGGIYY